eukprot:TRINITY_DN1434_c0_g1_i4.p1 TRINITY_DN1434_c0_g1~~TRINITY_DN1434_c0_g1_i4.p1  ORF type:complete len:1544 (+),score=254.47 TRINITY_DN1434_c0_g1_i4:210-4634(+)
MGKEVNAVRHYISNKGNRQDVVAVMMKNRSEWLVADFASAIADRIVVGLHSEWSRDKLNLIINELNISILICDDPALRLLHSYELVGSNFNHILNVDSSEYSQLLSDHSKDNPFLEEIIAVTSAESKSTAKQKEQVEPFTYMYSSGTSGTPKAVATPKKTWRVTNCNPGPLASISSPSDRRTVSYMSLAHGADRGICWLTSMAGGCVSFTTYPECTPGYYSQLSLIKPTFFLGMSCTWQNIYSAYEKDLSVAVEEYLASTFGVANADAEVKESFLKTRQGQEIANVVVNNYRSLLGGNLLVVVTGGACTPEPVKEFLNSILADGNNCRAVDSYGSTEFPGISSNGEIADNVELKLVPVFSPDGKTQIYPGNTEGEITVRRKDDVPPTYYVNRPEITSASWDRHLRSERPRYTSTGWYSTGDVGELVNGKLKITDRVSNLEEIYFEGDSVWIEPNKLEAVYALSSNDIKHVVLCCDRNRAGVGLIICLIDGSVLNDADVVSLLTEAAVSNSLPLYSQPVGVAISRSPWTTDNGLLTITGKPNRAAIKRKFDTQLGSSFAHYDSGEGLLPHKSAPSAKVDVPVQSTEETHNRATLLETLKDAYKSTSHSEAQIELFQKTQTEPSTYKKGSRKVDLSFTSKSGDVSSTELAAGRDWISGVEKFEFSKVREPPNATAPTCDISAVPTNAVVDVIVVCDRSTDDGSEQNQKHTIKVSSYECSSQRRRRIAHYLDLCPSQIEFQSTHESNPTAIYINPKGKHPSRHLYPLTASEVATLTKQFDRVVEQAMKLRDIISSSTTDKNDTKKYSKEVEERHSKRLELATDPTEIRNILKQWKRDMMKAREMELRASTTAPEEQLLWDAFDSELLRLREVGDYLDVDTRSLPFTWRLDLQWVSPPKQQTTQCMFGCGRLIISSQIADHTNNFNGPCNMSVGISTDDVSTQMGGDQTVYCDLTGCVIDEEEHETTEKPLPFRNPRYRNIDTHCDRRIDAHNKLISTTPDINTSHWVLDKQHIFWLHKYTCAGKDIGFFDTPASLISRSCDAFENRPAFGISMRDLQRPRTTDIWCLPRCLGIEPLIYKNFYWMRYKDVWNLVSRISEWLRKNFESGTFIAVQGYNDLEWALADLSIALAGMVSVPVHTSFTAPQAKEHLTRTRVPCLLTMNDLLDEAFLEHCPDLKKIVVMDGVEKPQTDQVESLLDIVTKVDAVPQTDLPKEFGFDRTGGDFKGEKICTLLCTSGTSGKPKLVAVPTRGFTSDLAGDVQERLAISKSLTISYIPLSHSSDRYKMWQHFLMGGRVAFCYYPAHHWSAHEQDKKDSMLEYSSPVAELFQQVSDVDPTSMACPPNIWAGLRELKESTYPDMSLLEYSRVMFGRRIAYLATGGSPTPCIDYHFAEEFCRAATASLVDSYGATECGMGYLLKYLVWYPFPSPLSFLLFSSSKHNNRSDSSKWQMRGLQIRRSQHRFSKASRRRIHRKKTR